jgi:hypothetical protein
LLRLLPAGTGAVMGADVSRLRNNPRWPLLLEISRLVWRHEELTGFDPSADLDEVLVAHPDTGDKLVMLRGRFDVSRIADFDAANSGARHETRYRGVRVFTPPAEAGGDAIRLWTVLLGNVVLIGPEKAVQQAIDASLSQHGIQGAIAARAAQYRGRHDVWAVGERRARVRANLPAEGGIVQEGGVEFNWASWVSLEARLVGELQLTAAKQDLKKLEDEIRGELAGNWTFQGSRVWKKAVEGVRFSAGDRLLTITGDSDWESALMILGIAAGRGGL